MTYMTELAHTENGERHYDEIIGGPFASVEEAVENIVYTVPSFWWHLSRVVVLGTAKVAWEG